MNFSGILAFTDVSLEVAKIFVAVALAAFGWVVVHIFNSQRDLKNRLLELRLQRLYEAFINLYNFIGEHVTPESVSSFQRALADIQLYGTKQQVEYAQRLQSQLAQSSNGNLDIADLLTVLRDSIRSDLNLEQLSEKPFKPSITISRKQSTSLTPHQQRTQDSHKDDQKTQSNHND
jgi:hypothetical protein